MLTERRGFKEILTIANEGGGGGGEMLTMADKFGRGGLDPPILTEIICEQSLIATCQQFACLERVLIFN